jgi:REP element-mobilizing transposase RayT
MAATDQNALPNHSPVGPASGLPVHGVSDSVSPNPRLRSGQPSRLVAGVHSRGALPHLKRAGAAYFVTFRLAETLIRDVLPQLKREREAIIEAASAQNRPLTWQEQQELFNWYAQRVDKHLDAGHGDCWLKRLDIARLTAGALRFFEGKRYTLHAWTIMPNHVHVVVRPEPPHTLSDIMKSWKGYTAVQANRLLGREGSPFWQTESYDHCCRDEADRARCCVYTSMNPVNAGLCARPEDWPWSSLYVGQASGLPVHGVSDSVPVSPTAPEAQPQIRLRKNVPERPPARQR